MAWDPPARSQPMDSGFNRYVQIKHFVFCLKIRYLRIWFFQKTLFSMIELDLSNFFLHIYNLHFFLQKPIRNVSSSDEKFDCWTIEFKFWIVLLAIKFFQEDANYANPSRHSNFCCTRLHFDSLIFYTLELLRPWCFQ